MWRPDRSVRGPDRASYRDIDPLNRVFAEAFTDRYSRDGLVGVRVPQLNPLVWRYALDDAGEGAMIWRDVDGHLVGFNMVHRSGTEGWMGPLAVRPDRQGEGLGSLMVRTGIEWLRSQGTQTIGLETMPRTVDNIGFYSRIGLVPAHLTVTMVHDVPRRAPPAGESLGVGGRRADRRAPSAHR
jgi:GNAT superfamily N-acetyltransferase